MRAKLDPLLWNRLRSLFDEIADLELEAQSHFVAALRVHEPTVGDELAAMLDNHAAAGAWLDRSVPDRLLGGTMGSRRPPEPEPLLGVRLNDRYTVVEEIGRGGLSVVYLARDEATHGRQVAIKVLSSVHRSAAIDRELKAMANLHHPAIAAPKDSGQTPAGSRFLVLEYIPGPTLRNVLADGPLVGRRVVHLVRALGSALCKAHEVGVWHLDLKPENVLLCDAGSSSEQPVLVDFGIARLVECEGGDGAGSTAGSLSYAAPEQWLGRPGAASDQYSLCVLAAELLSGSRPLPLEPPEAWLRRAAGVDPAWLPILRRGLSERPEDRFASLAEFVAALDRAFTRDSRPLGPRAWLLLAATLILSLAGCLFWWQQVRQRNRLEAQMSSISTHLTEVKQLADSTHMRLEARVLPLEQTIGVLRARYADGDHSRPLMETLDQALIQYGVLHGEPGERHLGQTEKGAAAFREAIGLEEQMLRSNPAAAGLRRHLAETHNMLASVLVELGRYEEATGVARAGLFYAERVAESAGTLEDRLGNRLGLTMTLSRVYFHRRDFNECLRLRNLGVAWIRQINAENHDGSLYDVAGLLATRGYLYRDMGRYADALRDYAESDRLVERCLEQDNWSLRTRWLRARNGMEVGKIYLRMNQPRQALARLEPASVRMRRLLTGTPVEVGGQRSLALCLSWLAVARYRLGTLRPLLAALLQESLEINREARLHDPANAKMKDETLTIMENALAAGINLDGESRTRR